MNQAVDVPNRFWHQLDELLHEASVLSEAGLPIGQEQFRELQRKLEALRDTGGSNGGRDVQLPPGEPARSIFQADPLVERILSVIDLRLNPASPGTSAPVGGRQ
ncbi:MAG: hypothetical protein ACE14L_13580 [Terriglobales bacterium]